jgi:nucleoside 2-deoxyribosyltransferase
MKVFVATRVSGEQREVLLDFLKDIKVALEQIGIEPYITELAPPQPDEATKLIRAFEHIDESDALLVIYKPGAASEGMAAEVGYAYGRKPVWILAQSGSDSKLFAAAEVLEHWADQEELMQKIRGLQ